MSSNLGVMMEFHDVLLEAQKVGNIDLSME
jgi:hypothetical protein